MSEPKTHKFNLSGYLSSMAANLFGAPYTVCTPIIAGAKGVKQDINGQNIDWEKPPKEAIYYNLRPDTAEAKKFGTWNLDYIIGESDALDDRSKRLSDGVLAYWTPNFDDIVLRTDDPVLIKVKTVKDDWDLGISDNATVNDDWLCLRRVGNDNGTIYKDQARTKMYVRSKKSSDGSVKVSSVDKSDIVGYVFGRHQIKNNVNVQVAPYNRAKP